MKNIAISKIFSYYLTTHDEVMGDESADRNEDFHKELSSLCKKHGIVLGESCTSFFNMDKYSIQKCDKCENMMMNRDKNPVGFGESEAKSEFDYVVIDGGEYEDNILCEECLPISHRWGLHS